MKPVVTVTCPACCAHVEAQLVANPPGIDVLIAHRCPGMTARDRERMEMHALDVGTEPWTEAELR